MSTSSSPNNQFSYPQQQQHQPSPPMQEQQQYHQRQVHHTKQQQQIHIQQQIPITEFPPVSTVEIPIRQHTNVGGHDTVPTAVVRSDSGESGGGIANGTTAANDERGHNMILAGGQPAPIPSSSYGHDGNSSAPVIQKQQHFFSGMSSSSNDHKTQYSASTKSTGSGGAGGVNCGNNLLQIAFPTAEFAIRQQLLLEKQQQAEVFAEQMQSYHKEQMQEQLPPLVVSVPAAPPTATSRLVPLSSPIVAAPSVLLPPPANTGSSTPWTLGSTDGTFALSLLLREEQEEETARQILQLNISGDPMSGTNIADTSLLITDQTKLYSDLCERLSTIEQQQVLQDVTPPSTSGAAILADGHANVVDNDDVKVAGRSGCTDNIGNNDATNGNENLTITVTNQQQNQGPELLEHEYSRRQPEPLIIAPNAALTNRYTERNPLLRMSGNSRSEAIALLRNQQSLFQQQLFLQANVSSSVEACLAAACEVLKFDIAEMWLRTGPKTHQLTYSHLRPTALEDSARRQLVDVYYGEKSSERTHRLSPALCKRAKEAGDVVWVTAHNPTSAEALRCSISNVRTAVAVPVRHEASNTNMTILFFSIRR
jgi:hypothetical protein